MWFRPRTQQNESDRFRMSSLRNKIRHRKSTPAEDGVDSSAALSKTPTSRVRDEAIGAILKSPSGRRLSMLSDDADSGTSKEKVLLNDQKYKNNRITKSSSRTKVPEIKIATEKPSAIKVAANASSAGQRKKATENSTKTTPVKVKAARRNTNLNLNALLRYKSFISGSTKKLTPDDFDRLRRKSLGETNKVRRRSSTDTEQQNDRSSNSLTDKPIIINNNNNNNNNLKVPKNTRQSFDSDKSNEDVFQSGSEDFDAHRNYGCESRKSSPSLKLRVAAKWSESVQKATAKKNQKCENRKKG